MPPYVIVALVLVGLIGIVGDVVMWRLMTPPAPARVRVVLAEHRRPRHPRQRVRR